MSLDTFNAVVEGYSDKMFDRELLQVHSGFWSGYYANSKHPRSLNTILKQLVKSKMKKDRKKGHADTVDVDAFLAREKAFQERLALGKHEE